uniref:BTB domain-containing protein n=1 Tax=Panagrolaimus sp. JU765 TaxID=591449 RepID=A0AC34QUH9_9BILA
MNCQNPVIVSCVFVVNSNTKSYSHRFESSETFKFPDFGKKSDLFMDGVMAIDVKMNIKFISETVEVFEDEVPHTVALLEDDEFKDFTICVDDDEIKVHKSVIAIASPVFSAMLKPNTKESKEGKVDIIDFDFETVKAGVDLMYTRKIGGDLPLKTMLNLYKFADKYDFVDKRKILERLVEKFSLETILEISTFSKANLMDQLYDKCVAFLGINFEANARNAEFKNLNPEFIRDVILKKYQPR